MSENKNARTVAATMGRAMGSAAFAEAANSRPNRTTAAGAGQLKIADFLLPGAENALDGATLAAALGCKRRELTRLIERERRNGAPGRSCLRCAGHHHDGSRRTIYQPRFP